MYRASIFLLAILLVAAGIAPAQDATTPSGTQTSTTSSSPAPIQRDPQAVNLASQSYQAMVGMTALQDATLQATVTWVAGSDEEMGTATLEAKGSQEGRMVLSLTDGQRQEVRNFRLASATNSPPGAWAGPDNTWHAAAVHNCWTDGSWFFPAFTLQAALNDPTISIIYAGPEKFAGAATIHLVFYRTLSGQSASTTKLVQRLSATHLFLDGSSGLPIGLRFNTHPDNDAGLDIPVEIHFSDYRAVSGVQVPTHIEKFLQGSLLLDFHVTSAQVNSGLTDGDFSISASAIVETGGAE